MALNPDSVGQLRPMLRAVWKATRFEITSPAFDSKV
jgi:hypothetical protein